MLCLVQVVNGRRRMIMLAVLASVRELPSRLRLVILVFNTDK